MMKTHTPGPWTLNDARSTRVDLIDTQQGHAVGEIVWVDVRNPADARLIAAAPDMLETLRDIVGMLTDANDMRADALHAARTAIVRATGGQA
jgi:hypothetical protein